MAGHHYQVDAADTIDANNAKMGNGVAYGAKLAMFDIGSDDNARAIFPPDSLSNTMFPPAYAVGARIHTNSWGGNSPSYSTDAREVDRKLRPRRATHAVL